MLSLAYLTGLVGGEKKQKRTENRVRHSVFPEGRVGYQRNCITAFQVHTPLETLERRFAHADRKFKCEFI